jgi:hypothetical protein
MKNIGSPMTLSLSSKAALVSLLLSHLFPLIFTFSIEEAAYYIRDYLSKSNHPRLSWTTQT